MITLFDVEDGNNRVSSEKKYNTVNSVALVCTVLPFSLREGSATTSLGLYSTVSVYACCFGYWLITDKVYGHIRCDILLS